MRLHLEALRQHALEHFVDVVFGGAFRRFRLDKAMAVWRFENNWRPLIDRDRAEVFGNDDARLRRRGFYFIEK